MKKLLFVLMIFLPVTAWSANMKYMLDVQINTAEQKITGIARLKADDDLNVVLFVQNLYGLKVDGNTVANTPNDYLNLSLKSGKEIVLNYEVRIDKKSINIIDDENVFLTAGWYPQPDFLAEYAFSVTLPENFIAVSESESVTVQKHGKTKTFDFQFNHPLDSLHLAASTRYVLKKDLYKDISIEAYFFKEDVPLADAYIEYTQKYLARYEGMLSPYPYKRFAIVENMLPTGNSMPTFTLLGRQVVKLPFIVKTSLGHEILHQWFGNSVYIDLVAGNWAEGLTTYLSDHYNAVLEGKDTAYRKHILVDYNAYVDSDNAMPLSDFKSRTNKAQSAVGYGKAAMVFHMLRKRYGDESFFAALRELIEQNCFRYASWHDIQRAFEKITGDELYTYFGDWLTRKTIPGIDVENVQLYVDQGRLKLDVDILQQGEPYPLKIPITFYTGDSKRIRLVSVKKSKETIRLTLDELPHKVVIDENYDLMRQLASEEIPPVLAGMMGKKRLTAVISFGKRSKYQPLIDALGVEDISYIAPDKITFDQIKKNSLIIAGYENPLIDMLFGKQIAPEDGVSLKVNQNPFNSSERMVLLNTKDKTEAKTIEHKIPHYGKYTELSFINGRNTFKAIKETDNGILVLTRPTVRVLKPDSLSTLGDMIPRLTSSRIIYVGERHDQFAHHINQLKIIKKIHEAGYRLAVGMEMFQKPFQSVVNDYMGGQIDEHQFLKKTEYFTRWRYDYNLYKPIIDYLKQQNIPLVALNVGKEMSRKVAREGIFDLPDNQQHQLPSAMDFSNKSYRTDLKEVFAIHEKQNDLKAFDYFLQAQTLWDEAMAETAQQFLRKYPESKLVVLAGNGHVRYKYGIPERLYRRNQEPFTVVVQDEELKGSIADYVLFTSELKGKAAPKLGVVVEEKGQDLEVIRVSQNSPAEKAKLEKGDVIKRLAGEPIKSLADLKLVLFYSRIEKLIDIQIKRADKTLDKKIELFRFERFSHQPRFKSDSK